MNYGISLSSLRDRLRNEFAGGPLRKSADFLLITLIFALCYTQYPLYSSNQNQYFLHGLADSGNGNLAEDWLANTADPTPVFSALIRLADSIFHAPALCYAFYALLMGAFLYATVSIVQSVCGIRRTRWGAFVFPFLLIGVYSALMRLVLSRAIGPEWTYLLEGGVAGQRILGTVFEPSVFGVFLVVSIAFFLHGRPVAAILGAVLAATFHPTYLLAAATLTAAYLLILLWEAVKGPMGERTASLLRVLAAGTVAFVSVLPILGYVVHNFASASPAETAQAWSILVQYRIPHHAVVGAWFNPTAAVQLAVVGCGLVAARGTRLFPVLLVSVVAAAGLTAVQLVSGSDALALLFPWRLSIYLVPLSVALVLGRAVVFIADRIPVAPDVLPATVRLGGVACVAVLALAGTARYYRDFSDQRNKPDRPMMAFVAGQTVPGDVFLIPIKMEDFRLATGAPIFVDDKSIPYRAADVLEWYRRILFAKNFYRTPTCEALGPLRAEGITHIVLPAGDGLAGCGGVRGLYADDGYLVYALLPGDPD
jgi:hypothetical protein